MLALYILITFLWIFSWKKRAFAFMFLGLFFLNPAKRWLNYSSEKKEIPNLKVMTFNIRAGTLGVEEIEKYIDDQNVDIAFLQEAGPNLKLKNLHGEFSHPFICFYSKYKVVNRKNVFEDLKNGDVTAQCEQIDVEIRGKIYRVFNVHLESFGLVKNMVKLEGNGSEDEEKVKNVVKRLIPKFKSHQEQVQLIRKSIEQSPYPVIVAGDFNAVPNSYEYYHISDVLKDPFYEVGKGGGTSFHDFKYPLRIDYIFTSKQIKSVSYKVDHSAKLSDHYPVIAEFIIN